MKGRSYLVIVMALAALAGMSGCVNNHQRDKQATLAQWDATRMQLAVNLATEQYHDGQYQKAMGTLRDTMKTEPGYGPAWLLMARIQLELGHQDEALTNLKIAGHLAPDDPQVHYVMGLYHEQAGNGDLAIGEYRLAWQKDPESLSYALALAESLAGADRLGEALDIINQPLQAGRQDARLFFVAGRIMSGMKMADQAAEMYQKALLVRPDDPKILEEYAFICLNEGKPRQALDLFDRLQNSPGYNNDQPPVSHALGRGECYFLLEQYRNAQTCFEQARKSRPNDAMIYKRLAQTAVAANDLPRGRVWIERAITLNTLDHEASVLLAYIDIKEGDYDRARKNLDDAQALDGNDPLVHALKGRLLAMQGKTVEARAAYDRALELDPGSPQVQKMVKDLQRIDVSHKGPLTP